MRLSISLSCEEQPVTHPEGQFFTTHKHLPVDTAIDPLNKKLEEQAIKELRAMFVQLRKERNRYKMMGATKRQPAYEDIQE